METNFNEVISKDLSVNSSIFHLILKRSPDSLLLELYDKTFSIGTCYQIILTIQKLHELNPYFKQFDSIDRVIKNLKRLLESNKLNIEQSNSELKLYFINQMDEDEKIYIKLNEIREDNNSKINKLIEIVKDLKTEIKELKEQKIPSLIKDNISMKEIINELSKEITNLKNKDIITSNLDKESSIVKNKEGVDLISTWINRACFCKNLKFKKLYRATEDGDKASDFHRRCDKKGPTLTIGKTKKGYIFGGFTMANWDSNGNFVKDPYAFVFSLNKKKY